jgi:lysophospholipase L1-like esterase
VQDLPHRADVTVLLIGVNDVLRRTPARVWREDMQALIGALSRRSAQVVVAGIPDFMAFPSLPKTLAGFLAVRGEELNAETAHVVGRHPNAIWVPGTGLQPVGEDFFAGDGFHPSANGYAQWALHLADAVGPKGPLGPIDPGPTYDKASSSSLPT